MTQEDFVRTVHVGSAVITWLELPPETTEQWSMSLSVIMSYLQSVNPWYAGRAKGTLQNMSKHCFNDNKCGFLWHLYTGKRLINNVFNILIITMYSFNRHFYPK